MTPDPFSSEGKEESEGTRPNFIGTVVRSEVDTDDDRFQTQYENDIDILYEIDALSHDWENVYELGINTADALNSKWTILIGHLENIYGDLAEQGVTDLESFCEFLEGKTFEFKDLSFEADEDFTFENREDKKQVNLKALFEDQDNTPNPMLVPLREVTDPDELAELGAESEANVEEVDF